MGIPSFITPKCFCTTVVPIVKVCVVEITRNPFMFEYVKGRVRGMSQREAHERALHVVLKEKDKGSF